MNATFKTIMLWLSLLVVIFLAWHFAQIQKKETPYKFSEFTQQVEAGQVTDVTITGNEIKGHTVNREAFRTFAPLGYDKYVDQLLAKRRALDLPNESALLPPDCIWRMKKIQKPTSTKSGAQEISTLAQVGVWSVWKLTVTLRSSSVSSSLS